MTNLIFLEAATQSEGAETIIESNEKLINFATAEVDALVEEQALYVASNVGEFVENDFSTTYENVKEPIEDLVAEATSIFAEIIASDSSDADKKALIEGYAHIIAMEGFASEFGGSEAIRNIHHTYANISHGAGFHAGGASGLANSMVLGAGGAGVGAAVGGAIGAASKLLSKERKLWKSLVKQERALYKAGAPAAKLEKIRIAKSKARENYKNIKRKAIMKGAKRGAITGALGGAVAGSAANGAVLGAAATM